MTNRFFFFVLLCSTFSFLLLDVEGKDKAGHQQNVGKTERKWMRNTWIMEPQAGQDHQQRKKKRW